MEKEAAATIQELTNLSDSHSYDQLYEAMLEGTIQALQNDAKIRRKKLFINGIRQIANPTPETLKNHFNAWLEENPEFKIEINNDNLYTAHPCDAYETMVVQFLTHPAFEKIHKLHKSSTWLQSKIWTMYDKAQAYIQIAKRLQKVKQKEQIEDPDLSEDYEAREAQQEEADLQSEMADLLSDYYGTSSNCFFFLIFFNLKFVQLHKARVCFFLI